MEKQCEQASNIIRCTMQETEPALDINSEETMITIFTTINEPLIPDQQPPQKYSCQSQTYRAYPCQGPIVYYNPNPQEHLQLPPPQATASQMCEPLVNQNLVPLTTSVLSQPILEIVCSQQEEELQHVQQVHPQQEIHQGQQILHGQQIFQKQLVRQEQGQHFQLLDQPLQGVSVSKEQHFELQKQNEKQQIQQVTPQIEFSLHQPDQYILVEQPKHVSPQQPGPLEESSVLYQPLQSKQERENGKKAIKRKGNNVMSVKSDAIPKTQESSTKRKILEQQNEQVTKKNADLLTLGMDDEDDDCQVIYIQPKNTDGRLPQITSVQQNVQVKMKKADLLTLGEDDSDDDCQVICTQPKNTHMGLPQIETGQSELPKEIISVSDSISLFTKNPLPKVPSHKKTEAKSMAHVQITRGIKLTTLSKPKEKETRESSSLTPSLKLNGAVTIIPVGKHKKRKRANRKSQVSTIDLTDDASKTDLPQKPNQSLPYYCELCQAQYLNPSDLRNHRIYHHKASDGMTKLGIPLVSLKEPNALKKLSHFGILNYIPVPSSNPDDNLLIPIINTNNQNSVNAINSQFVIALGPIRSIPSNLKNSINHVAKETKNQ